MSKFKDSTGREWDLTISFGAATRLKRETALDLDKIGQDASQLVEVVYGPMGALAPVLWVLLRDQIAAAGITEDELADRFTPEVIDAIGDALLDAILTFFHRRRSPAVRAKLPEMVRQIDEKVKAAMTTAINEALSK